MQASKKWSSLLGFLLLGIATANGQCLFDDPYPAVLPPGDGQQGGQLYESRNGEYVYPHGELRALVILVELDYADPADDPALNGTLHWPAHALPDWVDNQDPQLNLFDPDPSPSPDGMVTRYYHEASSGDFTFLADCLIPAGGGIFHVATADGHVNNPQATDSTIAAVNAQLGGALNTVFNHNSMDDFDQWILADTWGAANGPGLIKTNSNQESPRQYDHVVLIYRNALDLSTGGGNGSHYSPGAILGHDANTYCKFGGNEAPVKIMRHEFAHMLYGGNNFHTGGGGYNYDGQYFITRSSGWSNLGLNNCSLLSWNAWDRQRMGWKAADQTFEVSARTTGLAEVNGDLDATDPADTGMYVLRDFVTSGDALRIKLPFTDPNTEYPEFLWVENHQGVSQNGNQFDAWQWEAGHPCVQGIVPGLQMYVQIDKEIRQSTSLGDIYFGPADYLRPLDAGGHFDEAFDLGLDTVNCICYECPDHPFVRGLANPLTGSADRHWVSQDLGSDNALTSGDFRLNGMEDVSGVLYDHAYSLGNSRQVFSLGPDGNSKLGIGTNPSSATMMNLVGFNSGLLKKSASHS